MRIAMTEEKLESLKSRLVPTERPHRYVHTHKCKCPECKQESRRYYRWWAAKNGRAVLPAVTDDELRELLTIVEKYQRLLNVYNAYYDSAYYDSEDKLQCQGAFWFEEDMLNEIRKQKN